MLNEMYFTEVERENRILLEKMTKIMRKKDKGTIEVKAPSKYNNPKTTSLNEVTRKRELVKITLENQGILRRIQDQHSIYNVTKWEKDFQNNEKYLKNLSVYPVPQSLNTSNFQVSARRSSAGAQDELSKTAAMYRKNESVDPRKSVNEHLYDKSEAKKLILYKKGVRIGMSFYIVEISVDKNYFQIILDDVENPDTKIIAMRIEEGRQLIAENNNNYEKIISKIYFEKGKPRIKGFYEENISQQEKVGIEKQYVDDIEEREGENVSRPASKKEAPKQNFDDAKYKLENPKTHNDHPKQESEDN